MCFGNIGNDMSGALLGPGGYKLNQATNGKLFGNIDGSGKGGNALAPNTGMAPPSGAQFGTIPGTYTPYASMPANGGTGGGGARTVPGNTAPPPPPTGIPPTLGSAMAQRILQPSKGSGI